MTNDMSAVCLVCHIFQTCGMKAVVVRAAAALPIQSFVFMVIGYVVYRCDNRLSWRAPSCIMLARFVLCGFGDFLIGERYGE